MKKYLLFLLFFFIGCSVKTTNVEVAQKPNFPIDAKKFKIGEIKNDDIHLAQNIKNYLLEINNLYPEYLQIDYINPDAVITGEVNSTIVKSTYTKTVPIHLNSPACVYYFYPCKVVNSLPLCKQEPALRMDVSKYNKISKKLYKNSNLVIYNNSVYKIKKHCKPTKAKIECDKAVITIDANLGIIYDSQKYTTNYYKKAVIDACKDIHSYENKKRYTISNDEIYDKVQEMSADIAKEFISDYITHPVNIEVKLFDDTDVDMTSKDEKLLKEALENEDLSLREKLNYLLTLYQKYPQSCVIKYDLAVYEIKNGYYSQAYRLLNSIDRCDEEILDQRDRLIELLRRSPFIQ